MTDTHGCTKVIEAVVEESSSIEATLDVTNVLCFGGNDGDIDLTVNGGTPGCTAVARLACLRILVCRDYGINSPSGLPYPQRKKAVRAALGI